MVEAEPKAVVREPERMLERLEQYTAGRPEIYQDPTTTILRAP